MTEKRYFYTDPLAAAWMSKHFGMKFRSPTERKELTPYWDYSLNLWRWKTDDGRIWDCRGEIHPDSLLLLNPQVGDLIFCETFGEGVARTITNDTRRHLVESYAVRIIQRNGLAFHFPECETA